MSSFAPRDILRWPKVLSHLLVLRWGAGWCRYVFSVSVDVFGQTFRNPWNPCIVSGVDSQAWSGVFQKLGTSHAAWGLQNLELWIRSRHSMILYLCLLLKLLSSLPFKKCVSTWFPWTVLSNNKKNHFPEFFFTKGSAQLQRPTLPSLQLFHIATRTLRGVCPDATWNKLRNIITK